MRIITQNGTRSLNFDNIDIFVDGSCILSHGVNGSILLGQYASDKRAMEVFNEIHYAYDNCDSIYEMPAR